jgi:hypothetical protein
MSLSAITGYVSIRQTFFGFIKLKNDTKKAKNVAVLHSISRDHLRNTVFQESSSVLYEALSQDGSCVFAQEQNFASWTPKL